VPSAVAQPRSSRVTTWPRGPPGRGRILSTGWAARAIPRTRKSLDLCGLPGGAEGIRTPDLCNAKPTPTRRCGARRCSRQPRARSAFRDPFRHLGLRRIAGRSWKFFVLRAIDRLDDRQRIPPTPSLMILTLLISVSVAVPLGVVAAARQGSWTDRRGVFLRRIGLFANNATSCSSGEQPTRLSRASG
jgi:hypothetical protein